MTNNRSPIWPWTWPSLQDFSQSFNNGWTFGNIQVTNVNSTDPEAEKDIVSKVSYGKQLGRLTDAVLALAQRAHASKNPAVVKLQEIATEIENIKNHVDKTHERELLAELKALKKDNSKAWRELVK